MRRRFHCGRRRGQPGRVKRLVATASGLAIGFSYCRAARFDEAHGFPLTAALEWRKAAELLAPFTPLASRCWMEWERIMHLPRWLAAPVGAATLAPVLIAIESELEHAPAPQTPLPTAA